MISRSDINEKTKGVLSEYTDLSGILSGLLIDVEAVNYYSELSEGISEDTVETARNNLIEGGYGDEEIEEETDIDDDYLECFFAGSKKINYQMMVNSEILKTD